MANDNKDMPISSMNGATSQLPKSIHLSITHDGYKPHKPEGVRRPKQMPIPPQPPAIAGIPEKK